METSGANVGIRLMSSGGVPGRPFGRMMPPPPGGPGGPGGPAAPPPPQGDAPPPPRFGDRYGGGSRAGMLADAASADLGAMPWETGQVEASFWRPKLPKNPVYVPVPSFGVWGFSWGGSLIGNNAGGLISNNSGGFRF